VPAINTPDQFAVEIKKERAVAQQVVREAGLRRRLSFSSRSIPLRRRISIRAGTEDSSLGGLCGCCG